jgi:hypothetical protein
MTGCPCLQDENRLRSCRPGVKHEHAAASAEPRRCSRELCEGFNRFRDAGLPSAGDVESIFKTEFRTETERPGAKSSSVGFSMLPLEIYDTETKRSDEGVLAAGNQSITGAQLGIRRLVGDPRAHCPSQDALTNSRLAIHRHSPSSPDRAIRGYIWIAFYINRAVRRVLRMTARNSKPDA